MRTASAIAVFTFLALLLDCAPVSAASGSCAEEQASQVPTDLELCAALAPIVRKPSALPLNEYQPKLGEYLRNYCHRDERSGWKVDKRVRDTGPWVGSYVNGRWTGNYFGTHAPALVWYSPEMYAWLKVNRPSEGAQPPTQTQPIPDGAIIVKEMYRPPAAACAHVDSLRLNPDKEGAAIMIRDSRASHDGWFWGWFGWSDWQPDWPQRAQNRDYPFMGFGQYCTNCHASAKEYTFSSLKNIKGESGEPLVFFSQNFFLDPSWQSLQGPITQSGATTQSRSVRRRDPPWQSLQSRIAQSEVKAQPGPPEGHYSPDFVRTFSWWGGWPNGDAIVKMPSVSYDHVWVKAPPPIATSQFVTSDQCLGCHSAGGTGLQYDMTVPGPENKLINLSPYGTWSGSPMRLAGRDPVFFAQLASERETFHPRSVPMIDDTCLGCHGVQGQRQFVIDRHAATGTCETIDREMVNAIPYPPGDPVSRLAKYGALARDGVSCASCHRMIVGKADIDKHRPEPQNKCVEERQAALNPGLSGFAKTFTGTFFVGPPDQFYGQFQDPKKKSMHAAIGSNPIHSSTVSSSEMCGSCHTVHLPVLHRGHKIGHFYEQTTYPEWAFSDYRTGATPDGALPLGAGSKAQSCQACHMPNKDVHGNSYRSKIAAIQEYTNFPQAEHTLDPKDLDLAERAGLATHTLVGLNIFLLKMASQFPDILGLRRTDPMMSDLGIDPLIYSQQVVLEQAAERTASISFDEIKTEEGVLSARVKVDNRAGHKFPSGVAFRRAFIEFNVLGADNQVIWASGRTNSVGVIIDEKRSPIGGELWWRHDCSARIDPMARIHQPHYQVITRQDQAQIYEELLSAPPDVEAPKCAFDARPAGQLTTSFLSICNKVKDNRLLPHGFLKLDDRIEISRALGAGEELAHETGPAVVGDDPDYHNGGGDSLVYRVPLSEMADKPAAVQATLYYQATPPNYLQDRFCTSKSDDTKRLFFLTGKLNLARTPAQDWKLKVTSTGLMPVP